MVCTLSTEKAGHFVIPKVGIDSKQLKFERNKKTNPSHGQRSNEPSVRGSTGYLLEKQSSISIEDFEKLNMVLIFFSSYLLFCHSLDIEHKG